MIRKVMIRKDSSPDGWLRRRWRPSGPNAVECKRLLSASLRSICLIGGSILSLSACAPNIQQEGNVPDPDQVVQINPGVDDKNRVVQLLGSPSAVSTFEDHTWYYISRRTEQTAFLDPSVTEQEVLAINFNPSNIVENMKVYGLQDGRMVLAIPRVTPTHGNDLTIMQQLLGNLGRFNAGDKKSSP
jgi:outer membrane protein assembly factor BamE (lipoprotein component of BamABCDE complex)